MKMKWVRGFPTDRCGADGAHPDGVGDGDRRDTDHDGDRDCPLGHDGDGADANRDSDRAAPVGPTERIGPPYASYP